MEQRLSLVTLGVADVDRAKAFYEELGWRGQEVEKTVFFQTGGMAVVLWGREKLARDSGLPDDSPAGFNGVVLAQNVRSRQEVDEIIAAARTAGPPSRSLQPRRSTAAMPVSSSISMVTPGRSHTTRAFPWRRMAL